MSYPWRCLCGARGFVELRDGNPNKYPCRKCYCALRGRNYLPDEEEVTEDGTLSTRAPRVPN